MIMVLVILLEVLGHLVLLIPLIITHCLIFILRELTNHILLHLIFRTLIRLPLLLLYQIFYSTYIYIYICIFSIHIDIPNLYVHVYVYILFFLTQKSTSYINSMPGRRNNSGELHLSYISMHLKLQMLAFWSSLFVKKNIKTWLHSYYSTSIYWTKMW